MHNKFHNYIKKSGENISLTHEEREKMKSVLNAYMAMKPIRAPATAPKTSAFGWFFTLRPVALLLVFAVFASSAGISYAAEGALPGDILYPVKTRVNEPLRGAIALSASAKTAWAMDVAGERIKEAATLAASGRLDAQMQQELRSDFERHARQATENISRQESAVPGGSTETAVRFEAQLSKYERMLTEVGSAKGVAVNEFASSVKAEREYIVTVRVRFEERSEKDTEQEKERRLSRMRESAKKQFEESSKLARELRGALASSTERSSAFQLENASATISAGEQFLGQNAGPPALNEFQKALTETEELGVFLKTSADIRKRTGFIIKETERENRPSEKSKRDASERKGRVNGEFEQNRKEERKTASSTEKVQYRATTTIEAKTRGTEEVAGALSASSTGDGADKNGRLQTELDIRVEGEQQLPGSSPSVQSVLPVAVPSPTLP